MRTIDLTDKRLDLDAIIAIASDEPVILLTSDGREFFVSEADDSENEVDTLRGSAEFQRFLDERSQTNERFALDDIEFEIDQELRATKARGSGEAIANQNRIPIGISMTNLGNASDARLVYQFIADHADGYEFYARQPGAGIPAAAIDTYLILGGIGSIASLISLLWMAYERFIVPKKRGDKSDEGIHISVRRPDDTSVNVCLGGDPHTFQDFSTRFELMIGEVRGSESTRQNQERIAEIETSGSWIKLESTLKRKP